MSKYLCKPNDTISLIIFVDGASLLKKAGKAWAMFGMIADMEPLMRNSFENIISFCMIGTNVPDLNLFYSKHMESFENLIKHGVSIAGIGNLKIQQVGFIGDSQAIPRVFNTKQYNGEHGCIHCHQAGTTHANTLLRTYPYTPDASIRTNSDYFGQVLESQRTGRDSKGVKGSCWMSQFISIPDNIILDYMHVCCIGTMQQLFNLWKLSKQDFITL
jgi:hypothetical protein